MTPKTKCRCSDGEACPVCQPNDFPTQVHLADLRASRCRWPRACVCPKCVRVRTTADRLVANPAPQRQRAAVVVSKVLPLPVRPGECLTLACDRPDGLLTVLRVEVAADGRAAVVTAVHEEDA